MGQYSSRDRNSRRSFNLFWIIKKYGVFFSLFFYIFEILHVWHFMDFTSTHTLQKQNINYRNKFMLISFSFVWSEFHMIAITNSKKNGNATHHQTIFNIGLNDLVHKVRRKMSSCTFIVFWNQGQMSPSNVRQIIWSASGHKLNAKLLPWNEDEIYVPRNRTENETRREKK